MHVDIFDWDDEEFDRGNTRHVISAGYDPEQIEDAIRHHAGRVGTARGSRRGMIDADIEGEATRIIFEIDADKHLVIVTPITAFPVED